ncbi:hypothetical protein AAF712_001528 [Marasmius tenuissimus]|uniref:Uncharacterized protein n=1 Tax=Marasmius tenuissimus TaxID=585030 RepID=A0ABR3AE53_9AGAR
MPSLSEYQWLDEDTILLGPNSLEDLERIAFNQQGRYLALGSPDLIQVWDLWNLEGTPAYALMQWLAPTAITCMKWLDSEHLVTGHADGRVYIVRVQTPPAKSGCNHPFSDLIQDTDQSDNDGVAEIRGLRMRGCLDKVAAFTLWNFGSRPLLLAAIGALIYVWQGESADLQCPWRCLGRLPDPPSIGGKDVVNQHVSDLFVGSDSRVVTCYTDVGTIVWELNPSDPMQSTACDASRIGGRITDLCSETGQVLVADPSRNEYVLYNRSLSVRKFCPKSSILQQPRTIGAAMYLSGSILANSGLRELILWDIAEKERGFKTFKCPKKGINTSWASIVVALNEPLRQAQFRLLR